MKYFCVMLIFATTIAGCAPRVSPQIAALPAQTPADFPEAYYRQAESAGRKVLRVDPNRSLVTIYVRRAGALARLGHDHVVASHDVRGYVDLENGRADLYVALDRLAVDEPSLRQEAGLSAQLSIEAVEGTRRNMLEKVLDVERFPFVLIHVNRTANDSSTLQVMITLHGKSKTWEIPAQIHTLADGIKISGQMTFNQSDFGITPFSILGGAIQVQDSLSLQFRIQAL